MIELTPLSAAVALVTAYLCGSIPTGVLIARARGVDLTKVGSGNIGATNVARALGKKTGALVLLLDALKGFAPVIVARSLWLDEPRGPLVIAGCALLAMLGHVFPVWLKFRGGKGVATGLGVFLGVAPIAAGCGVALFAIVYAVSRISSLGSLTATTAIPIVMMIMHEPWPFIVLAAAGWLLIVVRHRGNIRRLLRREESKV
jgi:glycerol-3-phosphate acyltransferase PlsY